MKAHILMGAIIPTLMHRIPSEIPFAVGAGMGCVYLSPFTNGAGRVPFVIRAGTVYYNKQAHTNDLGKGPTKKYYYQWC